MNDVWDYSSSMKNPHSSASLVDLDGSTKLLAEGEALANVDKSVVYDFFESNVPQLVLKFRPLRNCFKEELNPSCNGDSSEMETSIIAEASMSALLSNSMLRIWQVIIGCKGVMSSKC